MHRDLLQIFAALSPPLDHEIDLDVHGDLRVHLHRTILQVEILALLNVVFRQTLAGIQHSKAGLHVPSIDFALFRDGVVKVRDDLQGEARI